MLNGTYPSADDRVTASADNVGMRVRARRSFGLLLGVLLAAMGCTVGSQNRDSEGPSSSARTASGDAYNLGYPSVYFPTPTPKPKSPRSSATAIEAYPACERRYCEITDRIELGAGLRLVLLILHTVPEPGRLPLDVAAIAVLYGRDKIRATLRLHESEFDGCCTLWNGWEDRDGPLIDLAGVIPLAIPGVSARSLVALGWDGSRLRLIEASRRLAGSASSHWDDADRDGYFEVVVNNHEPGNWNHVYESSPRGMEDQGCYSLVSDEGQVTSKRWIECPA